MKVLKQSRSEAETKVNEFLELLGISHLSNSYPEQLSGGQQQRAAIARALCLGPEVLLLDEPTSALDPESRNALVNLLEKLLSRGITIVISSHDISFLKCVMAQVYFIESGRIIEHYDPSNDRMETKPKISQFMK